MNDRKDADLIFALLDQAEEECEGSKAYAKAAMENSEDPELSKMFRAMAEQEIEHAKNLQSAASKKASGLDIPPEEAVEILKRVLNSACTDTLGLIASAKTTLETLR